LTVNNLDVIAKGEAGRGEIRGDRAVMNKQHDDYKVVPYSKLRRLLAVMLRALQRKPMMHFLIEVDVTRARQYIRDHKAHTGEALSFTAFLITCLAQAVEEHKAVQAYRQGSKHLVLFEDVDVETQIERDVAGHPQNISYIVRAANSKTFREIHHEIRAAQVEDVEKARVGAKALQWLLFLPTWLFRFLYRMRGPHVLKQYGGTVGTAAVGMFEGGAGWAIPIGHPQSLMMTVGGIGLKPGVVDGRIAIRDYLSLTISLDHEIIDGAPAARFTRRLKELIEAGYALIEQEGVLSEPLPVPDASK
jgi:pyruvate/2-oxoglutarate dehydrogenase complex dihydrolipoamide acyltransferase (E2) component